MAWVAIIGFGRALRAEELTRVEHHLRPLVERLLTTAPGDSLTPALPRNPPRSLRIWRNAAGFVVAVGGSGMGIDESLLVYDTAYAEGWRQILDGDFNSKAWGDFHRRTERLPLVWPPR